MTGLALGALSLCVIVLGVLLAWTLEKAREERSELLSRIQAPELAARMLTTAPVKPEAPWEDENPDLQLVGKIFTEGVPGNINEN